MAALPALPAAADEPGAAAELRLEPARLTLAPEGPPTDALRINLPRPDDPLHLKAGETAALPFRNATGAPLQMVWRGLRGVGSVEDIPSPISPGQTQSLRVTPQDSGTALLRAAPSRTHDAERGAAVVVVVPEAAAPAVDRDLVLLLQDWLLAADNGLRSGSTPPGDVVRSVVTVDGAARPVSLRLPPRARVRLRFVNGSVQRPMMVTCNGARPLIAAIDGQPSELFAPSRNTVPIGPGARYDLLLDLPDRPDATVRFTLKPTLTVAGRIEGAQDLLVLTTQGPSLAAPAPMTKLASNPGLPERIALEKARRADLVFTGQHGTATTPPVGWTVNGAPGPALDKPVLTVRRGEAVVFGLANASTGLVPLRFAGQSVRLLHARDDGWEPYWRDTLLLPPGGHSHVAFVADREGRWPIDSGYDDLTLAGLSCCFDVTPP